jgi:hypothetical protein
MVTIFIDSGSHLKTNALLQDSTEGLELLSSSARSIANGALLYEYEYDLDTSRGRKIILNTVTIFRYVCFSEPELGFTVFLVTPN